MSQRNPMNERYTTDKPQGSTRKSAASAKPVAKAAASVRTSAKPEKKGLFGGSKSTPAPAKSSAKASSKSSEKAAPAKGSKADKATKATPLSKEDQAAARKHNKELERQSKSAARERNRAINRFVPDNAEFKRLNRKRMIFSGIGFAGMIVAIILSLVIPDQPLIAIGLMVVAWVFFFIGMRIDTQQMRPLREQGYDKAVRQAEKKARKKK